MTDKTAFQPTKSRPSVFAYIVAFGLIALGVFGAVRGAGWSLSLMLSAIGVTMLMAMGRPLYRTAVYRVSADEVVCRYVPWYQVTGLAMSLMTPIIGIATIAQGAEPDSPFWLSYAGWLLLALGVVFGVIALLMAARNSLRFTPSALTLRKVRYERRIDRANFQSVTTRMTPSAFSQAPIPHLDLTYTVGGEGGSSMTCRMIDTQFTVDPANLLAALQLWKDADPHKPGFMDRIEAILRSQNRDRSASAPTDGSRG